MKKVLPWLFMFATVGTLLAMGTWQLSRLEWKNNLQAQYDLGMQTAPIALESIAEDALTEDTYRHVFYKGEFIHDTEVHLGGRRWHGKTGYQLITPMKIADGRIFLVNRGWIPFELKDKENRPDSISKTNISGTAVIRLPDSAKLFTPSNHPEKNFWFTLDLPAIEQFTNLKLEPIVLEAIDSAPDLNQFPIPSDGVRIFRNDHLGYALTWYLLAIAGLIMFLVRIRKQ